jgi:N-acylneuraminate cytidylyltransferase/CMP-N,N'-diacetyllegionaminic acid synthase
MYWHLSPEGSPGEDTMSGPRVLAIVPARGGSKAVPGKNLAEVAGKPLIAHSIAAAGAARGVERVVVSTDDPAIADAARRHGAEAPFLRPAELARDDSPTVAAVLHAVQWLEEHEGYRPDYVLLLQPTSPLRTAGDVEGAIRLAIDRDADSVVSVCEVKHHPYWVMRRAPDGRLASFLGTDWEEDQQKYPRRQELPPAYAENGAVYLARRSVLLGRRSLYGEKVYGYVMPAERSLDIDTLWDLRLADLILRAGLSS